MRLHSTLFKPSPTENFEIRERERERRMGGCEELSLELSIGGKYAGKSEDLGEKSKDFRGINCERSDFGVSRCDFSGGCAEAMDLQRRREIQASRRQEARRKREEKVKRSRGGNAVGFVDDKVFLEAQRFQERVRDREIREKDCFIEEGKSRKNGNGDELGLSLFSEEKGRERSGCLYPKVQLVQAKSDDSENSNGVKSLEQCSSAASDFHSMSQKGGSSSDAGSHVDQIDGHDSPSQAAEIERTKLAPTMNPQPTSASSGGEAAKASRRMPCVSATGDGPNGRTVIGFLYKYDKREVSIMCVCHGSSFSPAEFVEHAGGVDVSHPLRHITVVAR
ncbi:ninja-family protein AFP3-like [Salvia miltiorrhiza]|uniref:ninja-family protein AFP3-like n=1 Tax=Salvia miltiorrhiza TaxID=226208 RepID=UPI0025AD4751|nr:ninja-family protein AFP3-like [Salvia miltiorrhiza]